MTRRKNVEGVERNRRIKEGIEGVKSGRYKSYTEAAKELNIPHATMTHRAAGRKTRPEAHEDKQILAAEEETELVRWIGRLTASGYPPKPHTLRKMADTIRTRRATGINEPSAIYVSYDTLGQQWHKRFLNRHEELESIIPESIEAVCIKETSAAVIQKWFDNVNYLIQTHDIQPQDTYNMDETGFSIGSIKATRVIIDKTQRSRYAAQPGRQEWVSVIECISMDGTAMPSFIIFKGKTLSGKLIPENTPTDWSFSCNTQGWTSNEHCKKWLTHNFEPSTRDKAEG